MSPSPEPTPAAEPGAPTPARPRPSLALHYGLVSLASTWLLTAWLGGGLDPARIVLVTVTAAVAALAGSWLGRRGARRGEITAGAFLAAVLAGGVANGVLLGGLLSLLISSGGVGPVLAALFVGGFVGLLASLPFLLPLGLVTRAVCAVGRARSGSLVDDADRRGVWRMSAVIIGLATLVLDDAVALGLGWPALLGVLLCLILDGWALRQLHRLRQQAAAAPAGQEWTSPLSPATEVVDLGLGSEVSTRIRRAAQIYRDTDRTTAVYLGSFERAGEAVRLAAAKSALGGSLIAAVLALRLAA